ncbi:hypothetical protein R1flu_014441 [Riccia fluitans]|uniref:Uncharacterized protein n=1 Tax=Riccia fluitans TaxID=41844 RepID=A0ABD1YGV0_9MARC
MISLWTSSSVFKIHLSDDVQASPDFEEDLRTNERLRLRAKVRNLRAEPQRLTRSTRVRLDYEPTILLTCLQWTIWHVRLDTTLDLTVDAREDPSSSPQSQIVLVPTFVDLTQYMSSPENEGSKDQGWPRIMNVEQQQDGHSYGKHVLQMLVGAGMESEGLDRCFREEGLRYIATLDQVRSFDLLFPLYLSGKLAGLSM